MRKPIGLTENDLCEMVKGNVMDILTEQERRHIQEEWKNRHEELRKKLKIGDNESQRVMERYYGISSNPYKPLLLEKITLDRIMNKYGSDGYIVISAYRSDKGQEVNDRATRSLISDLKNSGYSYLPVYGGYRDSKTGVEDSFEPSFLVFNYSTNGETYFPSLKPRNEVDLNNVSRRFTLDIEETYVNPIPCTLNEERARKGEIMLWR